MLARADLRITFAALFACMLAMLQYRAHPEGPTAALLPLALFGLLYSLPQLARCEGFTLVSGLLAATVLLDEPHNFAYNEWQPLTKILGPLLYERLRGLGVPGLILTPFELLSLGLALWLSLRYGRRELSTFSRSPRFRFVAGFALLLPLVAVLAAIRGQLNGGDLGVALTQLRTFPTFGLWLYLGYVGYRRPEHIELLFKLLIIATGVKCLQGWWAFFVVYGGSMGSREYLMEHITSEHIATSMLIVGYLWWHRRRHLWHDCAALSCLLLFALPYVLNLRRASFLGLGMTLALLPLVYSKHLRRRHLYSFGALFLAASAGVTLLWQTTSPLSILVYPLKRFFIKDRYFALDYRDVENFNQYRTAIDHPLLGQGFGHHLKMYLPLTDISANYPLYDVLPHNNVLFLWAAGGPLAAAAISAVCVLSLALALRLTRLAAEPRTKLLAFIGWGMVVRWLIYAYTDLGLVSFRLPALLGLVVGMTIHLLATTPKTAEGSYELA